MNSALGALITVVGLLVVFPALAEDPPQFDSDPFGDSEFGVGQQPLILGVAHPSRGRVELSTMLATSVVDTYNSHLGLLVDVTYHPLRTLGFALSFGFNDGSTTSIIEQVVSQKLAACGDNDIPASACPLQPDLPDLNQVTASLDARVIWTPIYGKMNLVSEVDANLELYGFLGGGIQGQREIAAVIDPNRSEGWRIDGQGLGDGGFFADAQWRAITGLGVKVFLGEHVALRSEVMVAGWIDDFDFRATGNQSFATFRYFINNGVSFVFQ